MVSDENFQRVKTQVESLEDSENESYGLANFGDDYDVSHEFEEGHPLKPFEMYSASGGTSGEVTKMFLPEGSILWNGENVPISGVSNNEIVISSAPGFVYGHIFENSGSHTASIDRNETASDSVVDFKIAKKGDDDVLSDDEDMYQIVIGSINFGGSGGELSPGPFNWTERTPEGSSTSVKCLGNLYVSFGRVFVSKTGTLDVPSGNGILCVKITHPQISSGGAVVPASIDSLEYVVEPLNSSSNLEYTYIPLYVVSSDGEVACDLRNIPTAVVRE